jgi:predicted ArsR family transcriptional regulator
MTEHDPRGARRQQVLAAVQRAAEAPGVSEIATEVGIHLNTARFHLNALEADGVVERLLSEPTGPGRPRVVYRARGGQALGDVRRYQILAEMLLSHLSASSDGSPAAMTAGRAWGAHLIPRAAPFHQVDRDEAVARLIAMLGDLDFAPEPVADEHRSTSRIRLRHCPFIELAEPHRDLVCALHLGLMQGALAELHAPVTVTDLEPFAEPTACVAHLAPSQR